MPVLYYLDLGELPNWSPIPQRRIVAPTGQHVQKAAPKFWGAGGIERDRAHLDVPFPIDDVSGNSATISTAPSTAWGGLAGPIRRVLIDLRGGVHTRQRVGSVGEDSGQTRR